MVSINDILKADSEVSQRTLINMEVGRLVQVVQSGVDAVSGTIADARARLEQLNGALLLVQAVKGLPVVNPDMAAALDALKNGALEQKEEVLAVIKRLTPVTVVESVVETVERPAASVQSPVASTSTSTSTSTSASVQGPVANASVPWLWIAGGAVALWFLFGRGKS